LESLEQWSATAFLIGGILIAINAAIVATGIVTSSEQVIVLLGETVNAAGWAAALVGLLGLYPGAADRSRWLARIGAVCAAIGVVVFTVLSVLSFVYYLELVEGTLQSLVPLILPGVIIGSVLAFLSFSIISLRTDVHPRSVGILLLLPALIVVVNIGSAIAGMDSSTFLLGIVSGLALVMLAIGYQLRTDPGPTDHPEPTQREARHG
jgi:hypothetical protein